MHVILIWQWTRVRPLAFKSHTETAQTFTQLSNTHSRFSTVMKDKRRKLEHQNLSVSFAFLRGDYLTPCGQYITLCTFLFIHNYYTFSLGVTALSPCPPAFIQRRRSTVLHCCRDCCYWQSQSPWRASSWCPDKWVGRCSLTAHTGSTCRKVTKLLTDNCVLHIQNY